VARADLTGASALLQELLDHAERNLVPSRNLVAGALAVIVGSQDPFAQVQREGSHGRTIPQPKPYGYSFI